MHRRKLGRSDLEVSAFCLGTMTFGEQTEAHAAHRQLDDALAAGINFLDSAEMYPAPARAETYGASEEIIGGWLYGRGRRDDVVVATKAAGPAAFVPWIRSGHSTHDKKNLAAALNGSLRRLRTDYIDLYQLHWPDRAANFFGQLGFKPARDEAPFSIEETVIELARFVAAGKIRHVGLCNETPWGVMEFLRLARIHALPEVVSVQNPYNLLNRSLEVGLAEVACREQVSVLAYSPLAFGLLTGKYFETSVSNDARLERFSQYKRYRGERAERAAARYVEIARSSGLDPAHMALAWSASKPYVGSVIIGATDRAQLGHNLEALNLELSRAVNKAIDTVHEEIPNPCP